MNSSRIRMAIGLATASAVLTACAATSSPTAAPATAEPTPVPPTAEPIAVPTAEPAAALTAFSVTVENDECTFGGPSSVPYGPFTVSFVVRDTTYPEYGWFLFAVDPGRTREEVLTMVEADGDPPDWVTVLTIHPFEGAPGSPNVSPQNLRHMGAYTDGPVYILCARPDRDLGVFGPIEVTR